MTSLEHTYDEQGSVSGDNFHAPVVWMSTDRAVRVLWIALQNAIGEVRATNVLPSIRAACGTIPAIVLSGV